MRESSAGWSDQELIQRIRNNEPLAFQELFWRFQTLLVRYARQLGVQPALREELVVELLNDAVLRLMQYDKAVPKSLVAYLIATLRHRVVASARAARKKVEAARECVSDGDVNDLVEHSSSEGSLRICVLNDSDSCSEILNAFGLRDRVRSIRRCNKRLKLGSDPNQGIGTKPGVIRGSVAPLPSWP
jgi:DNA-directed RNA polymerase specialized sigma24 family protein